MQIYNPVKFSNFPFVTDEEIETLVSAYPTLPKLENLYRMNSEKFKFYQGSPFYNASSDKHKAHLSVFDRICKVCEEKIREHEQTIIP